MSSGATQLIVTEERMNEKVKLRGADGGDAAEKNQYMCIIFKDLSNL